MTNIITPAYLGDGQVTQSELSPDINVSFFINDAGYLTPATLASTELTSLYFNPGLDPLPEFAKSPGYTGSDSAIVMITPDPTGLTIRQKYSGTEVGVHEVKSQLYNYDLTDFAGNLGGPGVFYAVADLVAGHRFVAEVSMQALNVTTDAGAIDAYNGSMTVAVYEKSTGADEVSRNTIVTDSVSTNVHNELRVVNMPLNSGTTLLSNIALVYTGATDAYPSGEIRVRQWDTALDLAAVKYEPNIVTHYFFNKFDWLVRLADVDTTTLLSLTGNEAGSVAYCTDGDAGAPCLAVYDGTDWRRVALGATISTT